MLYIAYNPKTQAIYSADSKGELADAVFTWSLVGESRTIHAKAKGQPYVMLNGYTEAWDHDDAIADARIMLFNHLPKCGFEVFISTRHARKL